MEDKKWIFGVAGNIIESHTDGKGNVYYGTKAFKPGTKVYVDGKYWSDDWEDVCVIGLNRFGRLVLERVPLNLIENFRTQRIYKPHVLEIIDYLTVTEGHDWWGRTASDRKDAESFVKEMRKLRNI